MEIPDKIREVNTELYTALVNSAQEMRVVKEGSIGNVWIVDYAETRHSPIWPVKSRVSFFSLLIGGFAGVLSVFFRKSLAGTVEDEAYDIQTSAGLLMPGETTTLILVAHPKRGFLSVAAMLLPTNDTFVGLDAVPLPMSRKPATYMLEAYDAGTEYNDQLCDSIPGPLCMGEAISEPSDSDEGFVHVGNGFHEMGEEALSPITYDWGTSVAKVEVTRLRGK